MELYLESSEFIDSDNKSIKDQAELLANNQSTDYEIAQSCFEYVRDKIKHSWDYKLNPVTCKASEVLKYKTGYCYAKSHLLAALLRANNIPAGLCYQRLSLDKKDGSFCLHGLNAVHLKNYGWYRIDPRGIFHGIDTAGFNPPYEELAFQVHDKLEADLLEIWHEPLKLVTDILTSKKTFLEVSKELPDIQIVRV